MKTIMIASKNPVKAEAIQKAFRKVFPDEEFAFESVNAPSHVSDQPINNQETLQGALNRLGHIQNNFPNADYWAAIEGGIEINEHNEMEAFAWVVIRNAQLSGKARTGTFILPPEIAHLVASGIELGEADDIVFKQSNSKQKNGAVGLLTNNIITRCSLYEHAVELALIPFLNPELYA